MMSRVSRSVLRASCVAFCVAVTLPVLATTYYVDAEKGDDGYDGMSPDTARQTLGEANKLLQADGDVLMIAPGRYDLTAVISNARAKLAYRGTGTAPGDVVVNGGGTSRGFSLSGSSVTLSNFTISNCYTSAAYNGAGARLASGGTLTNMVFVACTNDCSNGGAVYASSWTTFVDCKFVENYTIKDGGAVYMDDANGTSHSFLRCTFLRNGAAVNGGVYGSAGQYAGRTMRDCRFEGNMTKGAGGCFTGPFTVVSNCQFIANWAKGSGGVYTGGNYSYVEGAASTTNPNRYLHQNCLFSNNVANSGGCFNIARTVGYSFRDCVFADNLATNGSGGCFLLNGGGTCGDFLRCSFYRNMATNTAGGSAGVFYGFAKSFGGCHFEGNRANVSGGCIYWGGTDENVRKITCRQNSGPWWMAVTNSTFVNNGLTGRSTKHKWQCGGGVTACGIQSTATYGYNINAYQPLYADCTFTSNFVWATTNVYQGVIAQGGVLMEPGGATLRRCTFAYNRVIGNGGAFCGMCTNGMTDCTFVGNAADYEDASAYAYPAAGGAVLLTGGPGTWTNVIERCVFSNNWVNGRGASALAQARSTMILRDSTFVGNSCVSNGFVSSSNAGRTAGGAVGIARRYESVDGGGRYGGAYTPKFLIERCSFVSNDTFSAGGAIASYRLYDSNTAVPCGTIRNCLFEGNRAYDTTYTGSSWSDILGRGAALAFNQTTTTVENCTFVGNVSQKRVNKADSYRQGGAVFVNTPNTTLTNCVFYGNADGTAATTYDDIYISDATKLGHCFAKTGGILVDKENDNIVSDANPFRADDHTTYAVRKGCGSGVGLKLGWMTPDSLDLGGKPRLAKNEDGEVVVDFGCYQFWRKPGLLLFVW